jgi:YD repeat-containing protein
MRCPRDLGRGCGMVAIFTGAGTGLERGSGSVLGGAGLLGSAGLGRGGEQLLLNAANGNLVISRQDEFLVGRGPDVAINRTYNSQGTFTDDNGDNWRQSTDRAINPHGPLNAAGGTVVRRSGDGSEITYSWNGSAYVTTDGAGAHDTITFDGTSWKWTDGASGITETYEFTPYASWRRIISQSDTTGNTVTFTYSGANLTGVTTADGGYTGYVWSGGNLSYMYVSSHGTTLQRTRYGYDGYNRLTSVITDLTPADGTIGDGNVYTTTYTYHGTSKLVATITQTDGSSMAIGYDGSNRVTSMVQTVASGVTRTTTISYGTGWTTINDPLGQVTTLYYTASGQLAQIIAPPAQAGGMSQTVWYFYDANGNVTATKHGTVSVPIVNHTNTTVTATGAASYLVSKTGGTDTYDGFAFSSQALSGDFALRLRPSQNNKYFLFGLSPDQMSPVGAWGDLNGIEFAHNGMLYFVQSGAYGPLGQPYAAGETFWMVRSGTSLDFYRGLDLTSAVAAGSLKHFSGVSGALYFRAPVYSVGAEAKVTFASIQASTYFTYDSNGNQLTATDREGNTVTRTYNANNQVVTETRIGADQTSDTGSHTIRYVYDSYKRLVFTVSAEGKVTRYWYDGYGQHYWTNDFPDHAYDLTGLSSSTALTESQLMTWNASLGDTSSAQITYLLYDARGNVTRRLTGTQNSNYGSINYSSGYTDEYFTYDQAGQLLNRNRLGQHQEFFVYDGLGRVTASTDLSGATTSIVFNDAASQTVVSLSNGFTQTSTYNKAGELISFTESAPYTPVGTASYKYDANGRLRVATDASARSVYHVYDRAGRRVADVNDDYGVTEYRYDANDRIVATVRYASAVAGTSSTIALLNDPNSVIDVASLRPTAYWQDHWTWTVYDKDGRVIEGIEGDGSVTQYEYDDSGQLIRTTSYFNKLAGWQIDALKASPTALTLPSAHANDSVARIFYDKDGRTIGTLDGEGYLTEIVYDNAGRKILERLRANATHPAHRAAHPFSTLLASAGTTADDRTTRWVYDGQGLLRFQIDALNRVTEYRYEHYDTSSYITGGVRSEIRYAAALGSLGSYTFASVRSAINAASMGSNSANRTSWAVYTDRGQLAYTIDAAGSVTRNRYDSYGRLITVTRFATVRATTSQPQIGDMDSWAASYATADDRTTRNVYDARGDLRTVIDAEGYAIAHDYDAEGRIVTSYRWDTVVSANDSWTAATIWSVGGHYSVASYVYDAAGRLTRTYDGAGNRRDYTYWSNGRLCYEIRDWGGADESLTLYYYDGAGRVLYHYMAVGTSAQSYTVHYYDGMGNTTAVTDRGGRTTYYSYDKAGQRLSETNAAGGVTSYVYNGFGEVVKTTDPRGYSSYAYYDALGRVISSRDAEDYVTETSYTAFSEIQWVIRRANRASNTAAVGTLPTFTPSSADAVNWFYYDKLGRLDRTVDAEGHDEARWYNAFGEVRRIENRLGGITDYVYTRRGQLYYEYVYAPVYDNAGTLLASAYHKNLYVYDARGNLAHQVEAYGLPERRDTIFYYDGADRLLTKAYGTALPYLDAGDPNTNGATSLIERYVYDDRGNVIETYDGRYARTLYFYDDLDRKIVEISATGTYTSFTYDLVGNLTATRTYATAVTLPGSLGAPGSTPPSPPSGDSRETTHVYDGLNRRTSSTISGVTTGAWNGSYYATSTAAITTSYAYDANGNVVRITDPNGNQSFAYYDRLGRKAVQVDAEGYMTTWAHDAEGNVLNETRYATPVSGASISYLPAATSSGTDRTTTFTYDKNGNRLTESRTNVAAWSLNSSGTLTDIGGSTATITYAYNALGLVSRKTEANGDYVDYTYDSAGRLIQETRSGHYGYANAWVTPTARYYYNGLDNLVMSRVGDASIDNSIDRKTRYTYGVHGFLASVIDAEGGTRNYRYDAAGRVSLESWTRTKSNGSTISEGKFTRYDGEGRATFETNVRSSGGVWYFYDENSVYYDAVHTSYNAYGEVSGRGRTASWASPTYQETYEYDKAGRLARTNANDGVLRFFGYDQAGNQTAMLVSTGADLAYLTAATFMGSLGTGSTQATTYTAYDKRGQATQTLEHGRQLNTSGTATITRTKTYNAFGEVLSESDGRGYVTSYAYNAMGRTIQKVSPAVSVTAENGAVSTVNPTDYYRYDISGRLIGTIDANGNLTTRALLSGSGHGKSEALVVKEWHPDGGALENRYDVFGEARIAINEIGRVETREYDKLGRLTVLVHPLRADSTQLTDYYAYDLLGNRTRHWNSQFTSSYYERTDYDVQGRVTAEVDYEGSATTYSYAWNASYGTTGMATFGGWSKITVNKAGRQMTEKLDYFGRLVGKADFGDSGGHVYAYTFDLGGRLIAQTNSVGESISYSWYNTGQLASQVMNGTTGAYSYDADGRRLTETWGSLQNATVTYDALGRMTSWSDTAVSTSTTTQYDANGNIRATLATYGGFTYHYWYKYDSMNRYTVAMGELSGGVIKHGLYGWDVTWNAAGERTTATTTLSVTAGPYGTQHLDFRYYYEYTADGYLEKVYRAVGQVGTYVYPGGLTPPTPAPSTPSSSHLIQTLTRDALGRVTTVTGTGAGSSTYNMRSEILTQTDSSGTTTYGYTLGGVYQGVVTSISGPGGTSTYSYTWWQGAQQATLSTPSGTTTYSYDVSGRLASANVAGLVINYASDAQGRVITRYHASYGYMTDTYYRFNGREIGNSSSQTVTSTPSGQRNFDFDQAFQSVLGGETAGNNSSYVVESGDTLRIIASKVWGDASLWYKLAEANGLSGEETLAAGRTLIIPANVSRSHNNASTFQPYDPNSAIGDTYPYAVQEAVQPQPMAGGGGKKGKCGVFGQILVAVVAVAISVALPHASAFFKTVGGKILGAMIGSTVSQGVGIATGVQDKFSFGAVAMAGAGAAIGEALKGFNAFGAGQLGKLTNVANDIVRGAASSALGQGVGLVVGMQSKFDFAAVVAAGIGSAVDGAAGRRIGGGTIGRDLTVNASSKIASAAARSILTGTSFGDNVISALPDIVSATFGSWVERLLTSASVAPESYDSEDVGVAESATAIGAAGSMASAFAGIMASGSGSAGAALAAYLHELPSSGASRSSWAKGRGTRGVVFLEEEGASGGHSSGLDAGSPGIKDIATQRYVPREVVHPEATQAWRNWLKAHRGATDGTARAALLAIQKQYLPGNQELQPLPAGYMKGYRAGKAGTLVHYTVIDELSTANQVLGTIANSAVGTATLYAMNEVAFGGIAALDEHGAMDIMAAKNPGAAMVGTVAGSLVGGPKGQVGKEVAHRVEHEIVERVVKTGTSWFDDIARLGTKNPDSNKVILGHFSEVGRSYEKVAARHNATYLQIDNFADVTRGLSQGQIWNINEAFLRQQVATGKRILFSHNPSKPRAHSFFEKEVNYLKDLGYNFKPAGKRMWEAVR